ncbi:Regulator of chromosome condensation, RCC1 [Sesbania bispinosa]|nr:Regulator of chromosome condensation, RCC1 [Sesbania bispinosa]
MARTESSGDEVPIKMVAAGAEHSVAVTEDGDLYGWGWGRYGNLGLGDRNDRLIPEKVTINGDKMVMVACGWRHTISVSSSGGLYTWGWGKYGQLGHGDFEDHLVPRKVQALSDKCISQISGGWRHTMALTSSGQLLGWGWNKFGQIGIGNNFDCPSPMKVNFPLDQKVVQMSCGWRHTIAVTERENVYSWGRGANGQLGHGDTIDRIWIKDLGHEVTFMILVFDLVVIGLNKGLIKENASLNVPTVIEAFSVDGSSGQHIESSNYPSSGKSSISLSERYAVVPNETASGSHSTASDRAKFDASVPESYVLLS